MTTRNNLLALAAAYRRAQSAYTKVFRAALDEGLDMSTPERMQTNAPNVHAAIDKVISSATPTG